MVTGTRPVTHPAISRRSCRFGGEASASRARKQKPADRLQTSLNLALGSALASIGLTIPAVAVVSIVLHQPLELGLDVKDEVLLALTLLVGVGTGRTTVLQGIVHLVIFAAFLSRGGAVKPGDAATIPIGMRQKPSASCLRSRGGIRIMWVGGNCR
jgi:hypothetical protein